VPHGPAGAVGVGSAVPATAPLPPIVPFFGGLSPHCRTASTIGLYSASSKASLMRDDEDDVGCGRREELLLFLLDGEERDKVGMVGTAVTTKSK
jgi:hypothetical protein